MTLNCATTGRRVKRLFDKLGMRLLAKPASEKNIDESSLAVERANPAN